MFRIGQKVTMKKEYEGQIWYTAEQANLVIPQFGVVYTIRDICVCRGEEGLYFVGIVNAPHPRVRFESAYLSEIFEVVVEPKKETDISVFEKLLNTNKVPVKENV